ncbi:hypothetical protein JYU34_006030 [Plutella xylostella]|uniref:Coiled-coil domain-containing protein n=1 Tax=Plutella xylostella TaxID=51655 RepID=A0ABQ7QUW7_PLUXY|nr:hypothetical protein JYU34_006030 [Plutella xylostella]
MPRVDNEAGDSARGSGARGGGAGPARHVVGAAGEHLHYHSDSETAPKHKPRYINPAICVETLEASQSVTSLTDSSSFEEITPHPHSGCSSSTPFLTGRVSNASSASSRRKSCFLPTELNLRDDEETPRYHETADQNTFRLSVSSLTTTASANEERELNERKKEENFKAWLARKEQEAERARLEKLRHKAVPGPSAAQREESYRRWLQRKHAQAEQRRAEEMRRCREIERQKLEQLKREREKEEKLTEWVKKKEEEMKAMKTKEERRAARLAIEEERRRVQGERAYREWLRTSRHKPLPVPLNQGELSMRGSISQMYINPVPWQSPI